jgi:ATP-dependent exoDNAse (exonuclease V) alpha subunit
MEINARIHSELQSKGLVRGEEHPIRTLVPRQDLTGADRTWAAKYEVGDVLRYSRASKETGIGKSEYAQVQSIDATTNRLTVQLQDGTERTYDPRRQRGVSVFREEIRRFSVGDRIQFTTPANKLKIANRDLGVIRDIDGAGRLNLKMDSGRSLQIDPNEHPHLDYGYAMTSHSSQGQTANRVLIHVDTELATKDLLNTRMAYVSVSRGAFDAQLFTNDREKLPTVLGHDISKQTAQSLQINTEQATALQQEISGRQQGHSMGLGIGL